VVKQQLDNAMEALNEGNIEQALTVIDRNAEVKQFEIKMDNEVLATIAQHNVDKAINLHAIIATSKIVAELEKMGNEIVDFSEFITVLYDPGTSDPNQNLLKDIIKIGELVTANLGKLLLIEIHSWHIPCCSPTEITSRNYRKALNINWSWWCITSG